ncbi:hypothetical protein BH10PSE1_BH10PSE1_19210 [soil metagenome]
MRVVAWSGEALAQFKSALDYLASRNLPAAQTLEKRIIETISALAVRPIGRPGHQPETYEKRITDTPYIVVHELADRADGDLRILHLFHMSQDWTNRNGDPDQA